MSNMPKARVQFELQTLTDYSDDAIVAELQRVAAECVGKRLTIELFNSRARVHSTTVRARFGSWSAALDRAGIDESTAPRLKQFDRSEIIDAINRHVVAYGVSPTKEAIANELGIDRGTINRKFGKWDKLLAEVGLKPVPLGRRYTDDECFENLLDLWTHYGRQPRFPELNCPPSKVGSKAYVRRWGGWRRALAAFVAQVNEPSNGTQDNVKETTVELQNDKQHQQVSPRSISLSIRYRILLRDRFRCVLCGRSPAKDVGVELHVDHIVPWSQGGESLESNLRTLCFDCNLGKGARQET